MAWCQMFELGTVLSFWGNFIRQKKTDVVSYLPFTNTPTFQNVKITSASLNKK
jgi:hypothetical protein